MKINLLPFQDAARSDLRDALDDARHNYDRRHKPQIISFTAATGAGKTIILISLVESVYLGDDATYPAQDDAIFIWLSDSPELNEQSRKKFFDHADDFLRDKLVTITDETFDGETLEDGRIYFLNTQKLSRTSNLTRRSDTRQFTIWETLQRTAEEKSARLYLIIDEAHRGAKNRSESTTIMQKFIKGSVDDGLNPLPVVIGVSATIERFNELVKGAGATINPCAVSNELVREAGLLKDRIIVIYPDAGDKEMSMLTAAAQDWLSKRKHWQAYDSRVKPVFIVQVQSGTGNSVSDTDLDECLKTIETATNESFNVGEVVHTFGDAGDLTINGLQVTYREPSRITEDEAIKIVLFKENLSTGWDCPRAETMMSFRRAVDATYIAQLIGRMIRTPLQRRIDADETLNEVCLFLPRFDPETVRQIIEALRASEPGAVTRIDAQALGEKTFETWTITPQENSSAQVEAFSLTPLVLPAKISSRVRADVLQFINTLGLKTYRINRTRPVKRLTALFELARLLNWTELYLDALDEVIDSVVKMIRAHVERLKAAGDYEAAIERFVQFKLNAQVINVFGERSGGFATEDLFSVNESDADRRFDFATAKLGDEAIATRYLLEYGEAALNVAKLEVILFAEDNACAEALEKFAEEKFRAFVETYRRRFVEVEPSYRKLYDDITSSADEISEHNFTLPNVMTDLPRVDDDGLEYADHLFVDEKSGTARIKLNTWEAGVLTEEQARKDFVCWLRNFERKPWALCLPYQDEHGEWHRFYPDMLIIRRGADGYVVDVLEPHDSSRRDNLGKARALATYATDNPIVDRLELIRRYKNCFKRLNMREVSEEVLRASTNAELDKIFDEHGKI